MILWALLFHGLKLVWTTSVAYELVSGVLVFGVVFMASDPTTTPITGSGKFIFGLLLGLITMLFRTFGSQELSFVFALLLMNC